MHNNINTTTSQNPFENTPRSLVEIIGNVMELADVFPVGELMEHNDELFEAFLLSSFADEIEARDRLLTFHDLLERLFIVLSKMKAEDFRELNLFMTRVCTLNAQQPQKYGHE